ncbi:MAG: hypothetical protein D3919_13015 [Candidatus Electrothrix sp. AW5]|nr:hypothetical protein [Candidatus Electrothrix gigas]
MTLWSVSFSFLIRMFGGFMKESFIFYSVANIELTGLGIAVAYAAKYRHWQKTRMVDGPI